MDLLPVKNGCITNNKPDTSLGQIWIPDLWRLQEQAPRAQPVVIPNHLLSGPFGAVFHGRIGHAEAARRLKLDGNYLVRLSAPRGDPEQLPVHTLSMRFEGRVLHYRLYNRGGEYWLKPDKRYSSVNDLVSEGLVTMYLDAHAGPCLRIMEARREASPAARVLTLARPPPPRVPQKPHSFRTHTFKGLNWCEFCGNFLWGFTQQGVKCDDCGYSAHGKCANKVPWGDCCPVLAPVRAVFGVDLTTLVRAHGTVRPFVVDKCVAEVDARGLSLEGIYRLSGFADEMDSLRSALERDGKSADVSCHSVDNINVVAGILKLYFRLLPIPLITYDVHPRLMDAVQNNSIPEVQVCAIRDCVKLLPVEHFNTLKFLMAHLHRVEANHTKNKMTAQNLGTVFAPTLMPVPDTKTSQVIPDMSSEITALCLLILHEKVIFQTYL